MIYGWARLEGRLILHFKPWLNYRVKGIVSYQRNSRNQDEETPQPSADRKPVRRKKYLNSSPAYMIYLLYRQVISPVFASVSLSVVTKSCYTYVTALLLGLMKPSPERQKHLGYKDAHSLLESLAAHRRPGVIPTTELRAQLGERRELHNP